MPNSAVARLADELRRIRNTEASIKTRLKQSSQLNTDHRGLVLALNEAQNARIKLEKEWIQSVEMAGSGLEQSPVMHELLQRSDRNGAVGVTQNHVLAGAGSTSSVGPVKAERSNSNVSSVSTPLSSVPSQLPGIDGFGSPSRASHKAEDKGGAVHAPAPAVAASKKEQPKATKPHKPAKEPKDTSHVPERSKPKASESKTVSKRDPRQLMHRDSSNLSQGSVTDASRYRTLFFSRHRTVVRVESRYLPIEVVGAGAYGIVCSAHDLKLGRKCAIKKVDNAFDHRGIAKRTLRELIVLRYLRGHENILELERVMRPPNDETKDLYFATDLYETDLASVIRSGQPLSDDHVQFFVYQVLRGLKYIHTANLVHRDLKPRNLLVNSNCDLKICDFGLCRLNHLFDRTAMSDYIATRWYRAPEIITGKGHYTTAIDLWSVGCILGELLLRKPLFPGRDEVHQLYLIRHSIGSREETLERFKKMMPNANHLALDLLVWLLAMDAKARPSVFDALRHPYLADLHEEQDEPSAHPLDPSIFHFEVKKTPTQAIKDLIWNEILTYNPADEEEYPEQVVRAAQLQDPPAQQAKADKDKKEKPTHARRNSI